MSLREETSSLSGFFGVDGILLRAGAVFEFPSFFCVVGLPRIYPVYLFFFW